MIGRICTWREADLPVWSRYGKLPHGNAVREVEAAYTWQYAAANDLWDRVNDGGQLPNYAASALYGSCPQVIVKPAG